jgi:hypothetical protein
MVKEQVLFRDTREKLETKREKREDNEKYTNKFKRSTVKKNISKKDADVRSKYKTHEKEERYADRRKKKE